MLSLSNLDIPETLGKFKELGIRVSFIVPTETGLAKSIMDAHHGIRTFLGDHQIHDFESQLQGENHKKILPALFYDGGSAVPTKVSLYRPVTKSGDPRIWIYGLSQRAKAGDLIALAISTQGLVIINCSSRALDSLLASSNSTFSQLFPPKKRVLSQRADELLQKLKKISSSGYIQTKRSGDTGVGYTLETLLNIPANSDKRPDYYGIEIKSSRIGATSGQTTIFSQVPNWSLSNLKSSKDILNKHGRYNKEKRRRQIFHEISCVKPNSYNLQLEIDEFNDRLNQVFWKQLSPAPQKEQDVTWLMDTLRGRLVQKHKETMWVYADTDGRGRNEKFHYKLAKHSQGLDTSSLATLLESGKMTVHYLIKETSSGAAKDQGYLFKMSTKYLQLLFDQIQVFHSFKP